MSGAYLRERSVPDSSNDCHSLSRSTYVAVATEAVKNYHGNYARTWYEDEADPDDSSGNYAFQRLRQTLFTPKIDPQFKLQRDDKVYAIGSCFARGLESSLISPPNRGRKRSGRVCETPTS